MTAQKTIGIVTFDGVLTSEVVAPAEVFGMATQRDWFQNWRVVMIGVEQQAFVTTDEGLRLGVDCTLQDAPPLDVLIVPGAMETDELSAHAGLMAFIQKHEQSAQWLASNCSGAFLLGSSGVLDGKRATTWLGGEGLLQATYPQINVVFDAPVVVDNRRLTSNGSLVSYRAALVLLGKLAGRDAAQEIFDALKVNRIGDWLQIEAEIETEIFNTN